MDTKYQSGHANLGKERSQENLVANTCEPVAIGYPKIMAFSTLIVAKFEQRSCLNIW